VRYLFVAAIAVFLVIAITAALLIPVRLADANKGSPFYVGVSFCGNTAAEAKLLIDRVKPYTNLFVLQSFPISRNETAIKEICDYAVAQGLHIIVNLSTYNHTYWPMQFQIFKDAQSRWGDKFLGAYYSDEPGGIQLDYNWTIILNQMHYFDTHPVNESETKPPMLYYEYLKIRDAQVNGTKPQDYSLETQVFLDYFKTDIGFNNLKSTGIKTFVSDYTLYWFDYLAGYDVVFAQFGSNSSLFPDTDRSNSNYIQDIDLVRGAARLQNKEWGAIITWKYTQPPYLDTGDEIYKQMNAAYQAGAKYVILFDYPYTDDDNPYGVLQDEHFYVLEKFWNDVMATSQMRTISQESVVDSVLVLPANYGWGMRRENDIIWGFWGPDAKSAQVWNSTRTLLTEYGVHLDIVYDDPAFPVLGKYEHVYFWNQTS
jgi:hypothetical protein